MSNWIYQFLSHCSVWHASAKVNSNMLISTITSGGPQGSQLGHLFFTKYNLNKCFSLTIICAGYIFLQYVNIKHIYFISVMKQTIMINLYFIYFYTFISTELQYILWKYFISVFDSVLIMCEFFNRTYFCTECLKLIFFSLFCRYAYI